MIFSESLSWGQVSILSELPKLEPAVGFETWHSFSETLNSAT